ncbi:Variable outer membrane protein (plasmid) [Borrelia hermsii YBT]|uniref:Variable large protein n=1 Tax=Borrelia hermsii YBT TaxID=1313295 RepID=W5T2Z3_BORHE|nr:Variable outer membrane protein [Borrelia hermsii YBT]
MKREGNPNASATETAVNKLVTETLDKIIDGAKTASEAIGDAGDMLGNVSAQNNGGVAGEVDKLVKGIKLIVELVLGDKGNPEAGDDKKAEDGSTSRDNNAAGMLFASNNAGANASAKKSVADAAKAVGAVTGADILQAISKGNEGDAVKLAKHSAANGNAANAKKDAVVAGAMALRAMAKEGKFANSSDTDVTTEIRSAAISAVIKALDTLTIAIRKAIDAGLKTVKDAMKINANDTPISPDQSASKATVTN